MPVGRNIAQKRARKILRIDYGRMSKEDFNELVKVDNDLMSGVDVLFLGGSNTLLQYGLEKSNLTEKKWTSKIENAFEEALKYDETLGGGAIYVLSFKELPEKKECFTKITAEVPYLKMLATHNKLRKTGNMEDFKRSKLKELYEGEPEVNLLDVEFNKEQCKIPKRSIQKFDVNSSSNINDIIQEIKKKLKVSL